MDAYACRREVRDNENSRIHALEEELSKLEEEARQMEIGYTREFEELNKKLKRENDHRTELEKELIRLREESRVFNTEVSKYFQEVKKVYEEQSSLRKEESKIKNSYPAVADQVFSQYLASSSPKYKNPNEQEIDYRSNRFLIANPSVEEQNILYKAKFLSNSKSRLQHRFDSVKRIREIPQLLNTKSSKVIKLSNRKINPSNSDRNEYFD